MSASSWPNSLQLLSLPSPSLFIGLYSSSSLPPLSPSSFHSSCPLTNRLRHADLLLYSLLTYSTPSLTSQLPLWPPLDHAAAVKLRAELSKLVEKVLKAEKDSWKEQLTWRRSFLDEAKGEKWEKVLDTLAAVALRTSLERKELQKELADLGHLPSIFHPSSIAESTSLALQLYLTESSLASFLVQKRTSELVHLRQQGRELLETRASLTADGKVKKVHAELDLLHLKALRDQRAQKLRAGIWELLMRGDPRAIVGGGGEVHGGRTTNSRPSADHFSAPSPSPFSTSPSQLPSPTTHLALLSSLFTLSDPPPPLPLPTSTTPTPTSSATPNPPSWSGAFALDRQRLAGLPNPQLPPPPSVEPASFDYSPPPSILPSSKLLRRAPPDSTEDNDDSLELRIARVLDSVDPSTPPAPPAPAAKELGLAGAAVLRRSRLPERVRVKPSADARGREDQASKVEEERARAKEPLREVQSQPLARRREKVQLQEAPTPKVLGMGREAERVLEEMLDGNLSMSDEGELGGVSYSR